MRNFIFAVAVCMLPVFTLGCGSSEGRVPVSGNVTLDGQPLASGNIAFIGDEGYAVGSGSIKNGQYVISESGSRTGLTPSLYKIQIESWEVEPGTVLEDGSFAKGKLASPAKYAKAATSELTAEVTEKQRKFDFQLTSK